MPPAREISNRLSLTSLLLVFAPILLLNGCEENLAPRDRFDRPFSLYGVISPDLSIQAIRVYPLEDFLPVAQPLANDVIFTSIDLNTGEARQWKDSVETDLDGLQELIFWSAFRAEYGHRYRVEATRVSDGALSYAEVQVPSRVEARLYDNDSSVVRIIIEAESLRVLKPSIVYQVNGSPNGGIQGGPLRNYTISYEGLERAINSGWQLTIQTTRDRREVQAMYTAESGAGGIVCPILDLRQMVLNVLIGDAAWDPPGGVFDPDILSFPSAMSNVENGFGFVGSGYRLSQSLFPPRATVEYACFNYVWQ